MSGSQQGLWVGGDAYEQYMGRWSRRIAPLFLEWLAVPVQRDWLDVGCGTGVLSAAIIEHCAPSRIVGVDPSAAFIGFASERVRDPRFSCRLGTGESVPCKDGEFAVAVAGLVLNFVSNPQQTLVHMKRCVEPGGTVAAYVWDYAAHMQIMRRFFDTAIERDAAARTFDDGINAPICRPAPLAGLFEAAGLGRVEVTALDITAAFASFDDYWTPFLGGTGSAPKYVASLSPPARDELRDALRARLPTGPDGEILLALRAWSVKGRVGA